MKNRIPSFLEFVDSITITNGGSGYTVAPTLFFPAPTGDNPVTAAATLTLTGGVITGVTITEEGDGYNTAPVPYVIGSPTRLLNTSSVDSNRDAGTYTNIPTTTNSDTGSGATVNITVDSTGAVTDITVNNDGNDRYKELDTLTVNPLDIGGLPSDDSITATITRINNGLGATFTTTVNKINKGDVYSQPKIDNYVKNQLPEFMQDDFPLFATFIQKYYQFMQQTSSDATKHGPLKVLQDFLSKLDVDFNDDGSINTDDNFLKEFYQDYAKDLPQTSSAKLSRTIKNINQFYTAKGSPEAVKYLFKVLFDEDVSVVNREQYILRPSSNVWQQDYVVKVNKATTATNEPEFYEGASLDIHYKISTGSATQSYKKNATVERVKKIAYTNPQAYELTLNLPTSFEVVGAGIGQAGYDEMLHAYVSGAIASVTGTGTGGAFENPSSTVVDGTYTVTASDYTARLDTEWAQSKEYAVGDHVKTAAGRQYVVVGAGTSKSTGSGPTHEGHPDKIDGTVKFRFAGVQDKATSVTDANPTGSSGATFTVSISGNAIASVTVTNAGDDYFKGEIIEIPASFFGGSGTPPVKFKVDTISNGKIAEVLILDGGTGFSANPSITITPNESDTITSDAVITTRLKDKPRRYVGPDDTTGVITQTSFINNAMGVGYNNTPSLKVNPAPVTTFITTKDDESNISKAQMIPIRILTQVKFKEIKDGSSTTAGGFQKGDTFKISESGDILGVYALDYFAEDYTLTGISNDAYIRVKQIGSDGYPTAFDIMAVGVGFIRADFTFDIISSTSQTCTIDCKTGYNSVLLGTHRDAGSFLSDINRLYDNRLYQPFSYSVESENQQSTWNDYVKRATHAAGFGLFGDLQIKQDLDLSSHFGVETDVYMFFKYPDTEEILVDETVVKAVEIGEAGPDEIFPGDGFASRAGGTTFNRIDFGKVSSDSVGISDEVGPYVLYGTLVRNYYATSDGTPTGDNYFTLGANEDGDDDYHERFAPGDYFAEDYVELGQPQKEVGKVLADSPDVDDTTAFDVTMEAADSIDFSETVVASFVFFREPDDTFDTADSVVLEPGVRPSDSVGAADTFDKFDVTTAPSEIAAMQDSTTFDVTTTSADTSDVDDSTAFDVTTTSADTYTAADSPSVEAGPVLADTFVGQDAVDKFDIGVVPSDSVGAADTFDKFDVTTTAADDADSADAIDKLDVTTTAADTFGAADTGNLISQSYTVDLTYFAEDYVADTVINF